MSQTEYKQVNISAPNLLNICVDGVENGEIQGRIYHYYGEEPERFESVLQLIWVMERYYDRLIFPQSSTETRSFLKERTGPAVNIMKRDKLISADTLISQTGKIGTFVTNVKFRQCTTWKGEFWWKEKAIKVFFSSTLEFIRGLDQAVEKQ